ncbi:hypothetical protein BBJ28_00026165 [Nothophytophthora sp. Chile5]|nr:hypothetical protein BBJ28_00026165 [Nothophytophthora sp. Chile5]
MATAQERVVATESDSEEEKAPRPAKRQRTSSPFADRSDAWFREAYGCRRSSFSFLCDLVERHWSDVNGRVAAQPPSSSIRDRVAVTIYYLTHSGGLEAAAEAHGMTPTAANRYIWQVIEVLLSRMVKTAYFRLPKSDTDWTRLSTAFEALCGFPDCCLAVGGLLVEIQRPRDWEGWYCSKNFPAENVQLVVDAQCRIRSMDVRPGSVTDRETLNYSRFGRNLAEMLPEGKHIVGHAGFLLSKQVMVPYPATNSLSPAEKLFNKRQATTQRTVKRTREMLKKRFRILQKPLDQKTEDGDAATTQMAKVISTAIVLHNVLVDLDDLVELDSSLEDDTDEEDANEGSEAEDSAGEAEERDEHAEDQRDRVKKYLFDNRAYLARHYG